MRWVKIGVGVGYVTGETGSIESMDESLMDYMDGLLLWLKSISKNYYNPSSYFFWGFADYLFSYWLLVYYWNIDPLLLVFRIGLSEIVSCLG